MCIHLVLTSGLVREQEAGLQAFLSHDGFSVLMRGMQSENEKLRTKSAFLLLNLLTSHPEEKGKKERGAWCQLRLGFREQQYPPRKQSFLDPTYVSVSSVLQSQLSRWVWYSSWYLFSKRLIHLFMNMCLVPFAGKKGFLLCHLQHTSCCLHLCLYLLVFLVSV